MPRTGLPSPRVESPELQRWIEQVSQLARDIDGRIDRLAGDRRAAAAPAAAPTTPDTSTMVPELAIPPQPLDVEAFGGIGLVMVSWANPFRSYSNHARSIVYRGASENFDEAAEIGASEWLLYVDRAVTEDTTYHYWVRFESTASVQGPVSERATAETGTDPEAFHDRLLAWIRNDPLSRDLRSDIELPATVAAEIRRTSASLAAVLADLALGNSRVIASIEATTGGPALGPAPNRFSGDNRDAAEALRDMQGEDNPAWLAAYSANPDNAIELNW